MLIPPLYVMAEHSGQTAVLKAALAQSAVAGIMPRIGYADIAADNFAELDAMMTLALQAGKKAILGVSPLPMLPGSASLTLDGEALPLAWEPDYLADCAGALTILAEHLTRNKWMDNIHGLRLAFTTAADNDCELGFRMFPPNSTDTTPIYLQEWSDAGLTPEAYIAAVGDHAAAIAGVFPGKDVSLSVLDPLANRLGPNGTTLAHRDHGALSKQLNQIAVNALAGSGCTFTAFNTNFSPKLPAADMIYTQEMAQLGLLGLQLADTGETDADFIALVKAAAQFAPNCIEIHQKQATPGLFAGLG